MTAITVVIDLDERLPENIVGRGSEGEYLTEPVTMREAIISAAVDTLAYAGTEQMKKLVADLIDEQVTQLVAARLPQIVEEAFSQPITYRESPFGTEHTRTLHEVVVERARRELDLSTLSQRSYHNMRGAARFIAEHVEKAVRDDLQEELEAARKTVKAKVTAKAAELLAADTIRAAGIR